MIIEISFASFLMPRKCLIDKDLLKSITAKSRLLYFFFLQWFLKFNYSIIPGKNWRCIWNPCKLDLFLVENLKLNGYWRCIFFFIYTNFLWICLLFINRKKMNSNFRIMLKFINWKRNWQQTWKITRILKKRWLLYSSFLLSFFWLIALIVMNLSFLKTLFFALYSNKKWSIYFSHCM